MKLIITVGTLLIATVATAGSLDLETTYMEVDAGPHITGEYNGSTFGAMLSTADPDFPGELHTEGMMSCADDTIIAGSTMENLAADQAEFFSYAEFTVDEAMIYTISGSFNRTIPTCGVGELPNGSFQLHTYLLDLSVVPAPYLFRNDQNGGRAAGDTCDLTYTIGEEGGSASNVLEGDITGDLIPGKVYGFYVRETLGVFDSAGHDNQVGSGSVQLKITPVPEPGMVAMLISSSGLLRLLQWMRS